MKYLFLFLVIQIICLPGFAQTNLPFQRITHTNKHEIIHQVISPDGKKTFFTVEKKGIYILFEADIDEKGTLQSATKIATVNNLDSTGLQIKGIAMCYSGDKVFFAAQYPLRHLDFDIYSIEKKNGKWSLPVRLPDSINSKQNETDPTVSTCGDELFFTRETANSRNEITCSKILYSKLINNHVWQKAKELPYPVNTNCTQQAFLCADNTTLLFVKSSQKNDSTKIYYTQRITPKIWTPPTEIHIATDSSVTIAYPQFAVFDSCLYFNHIKQDTSGIKHSRAKLLPKNTITTKGIIIQGLTVNGKTAKAINCSIKVSDALTNKLIYKTNSKNGRYFLPLYSGINYSVKFTKKNHTTVEYHIAPENLQKTRREYKTIKLFPLVELQLQVFDNKLFIPTETEIKIESKTTSDKNKSYAINKLSDGNYVAELPVGYNYNIGVTHPNYRPVSFAIPLDGSILFKNYSKTLFIEQILVPYKVEILDKQTGDAVQAAIEVYNSTKKTTQNFGAENAVNGTHSLMLRKADTYKISITNQKGYFDQEVTLKPVDDKKITTQIQLQPLTMNSKLLLDNVTFEENAVNITEESIPELQKIVSLLRNNPTISIKAEVYYSNEKTSTEYDQRLSDFRAKELEKYFLNYDIKKVRIKTEGIAEKYKKDNASEEQIAVLITITSI